MPKVINDRCPLREECGRKKCEYKFKEATCAYYAANNRDGYQIDDQKPKHDAFFDIFADDGIDDVDEKGHITYIPISDLHPHPDNPRKDLGDLTELVASIKENGVFQNLTVVPGHSMSHEEWSELSAQYQENPTEELRRKINSKRIEDGYTVIIGHRRMAAAKEAGLTELPCVVTEMDEATQISTMLLENMQRADLTVYEQAQGMQMLLDLGDSVADISKKTGFSEKTVRRRVKLLDLDKEAFKAAGERGATLADFVKLDQIEDPDLKNEVLKYIGTNDFTWKLNNAISTEKTQKTKKRWIEIFNSFATKVKKKSDYKQIGYCHYMGSDPDTTFTVPKDANEVAYFYYVENNYIYLLKDKDFEEPSDPAAESRAKKQAEKEQRLNDLSVAEKTARDTRRIFVQNYVGKKEDLPELIKFLSYVTLDFGDVDEAKLATLLCIEWGEDEDDFLCDKPEYIERCEKHPYAVLLHLLFEMWDYNEHCHDWQGAYQKNSGLERWYSLLVKLGYPMSTEEQRLLDGTHELYLKTET